MTMTASTEPFASAAGTSGKGTITRSTSRIERPWRFQHLVELPGDQRPAGVDRYPLAAQVGRVLDLAALGGLLADQHLRRAVLQG